MKNSTTAARPATPASAHGRLRAGLPIIAKEN
jgi:hypothetical protein